ncbi:hypothetical protein D3C74_372140 [compost metagenome]
MAAQNKAAYILHRNVKLLGDKSTVTRGIQHAGLADDAVFGKAQRFEGHVSHGIYRVAQDDDNGFRRHTFHILAHRFHNARIRIHQIIAAHPRFAGNPCCYDNDIRISCIPVI